LRRAQERGFDHLEGARGFGLVAQSGETEPGRSMHQRHQQSDEDPAARGLGFPVQLALAADQKA
jgi:hypothetical protein